MSARNCLVICPDRRIVSDLAPILSQMLPLIPVNDIGHYPDRSQVDQLVSSHQPTLCFLDFATNSDQAFAVLANLATVTPQTKVVGLLGSNNPDVILRCLRQGASEFVIQPVTGEQLAPVLTRLKEVAGDTGGKLYAVMPVKGAVGASTLASNLVYQWKRQGAKKILLADLDLTSGTQSFLLKTKSNYSYLDALARADGLDSDLWKGVISTINGVDVLFAPENPVDMSHELPDPAPVLVFCKQVYEVVAVDLGEPYSYWSRYVARAADEILLVTTNELPALRAAQRVIDHLERNDIPKTKMRLVTNRYNPEVGLNQEAIETALQHEVLHLIPSDYEGIQRALVEGKPLTSGPFGKNLAQLGEKLWQKEKEKEAKGPGSAPKKKGWGSFLGGLLGKKAS